MFAAPSPAWCWAPDIVVLTLTELPARPISFAAPTFDRWMRTRLRQCAERQAYGRRAGRGWPRCHRGHTAAAGLWRHRQDPADPDRGGRQQDESSLRPKDKAPVSAHDARDQVGGCACACAPTGGRRRRDLSPGAPDRTRCDCVGGLRALVLGNVTPDCRIAIISRDAACICLRACAVHGRGRAVHETSRRGDGRAGGATGLPSGALMKQVTRQYDRPLDGLPGG